MEVHQLKINEKAVLKRTAFSFIEQIDCLKNARSEGIHLNKRGEGYYNWS